jgi:hypothetical protein
MSVIPVTLEKEIRRPAQAKHYGDLISTNKPGMIVADVYNPNYMRGIGKRPALGKNMRAT